MQDLLSEDDYVREKDAIMGQHLTYSAQSTERSETHICSEIIDGGSLWTMLSQKILHLKSIE